MDHVSREIKDTKELAKRFLMTIKGLGCGKNKIATVVGLYGNLGTGKTTFTQAFAKELGIKTKVNSPTFVIMKRYKIPSKKTLESFKHLIHIDAYRIKSEKELIHLDWEGILKNKENLVFIEWPELIKKALPQKHLKIYITHTKDGHRKFKLR